MAMVVLMFYTGQLLYQLFVDPESRHPKTLIVLIALLGIVLRVLWITQTQPLPESDFAVYWDYVNRISHGQLDYDVIERHPGIVLLYVFFLSGLKTTLVSAWMVNLFFSVLLLLLLYRVGSRVLGQHTGLLAMLFGALLPQFITYTALIATEIPAVTLFLMIIWKLLDKHQQSRWTITSVIGLGFLFYAAVLIRSTSLLLLFLMPIPFLALKENKLKLLTQVILPLWTTVALLLSTWVTHQTLITGIPKLFFGEELWLAYATQYHHNGSVFPIGQLPYYKQYQALLGNTVQDKVKAYHFLGEQSFRIIQQYPAKYLLFGFTRMQHILLGSKTGILWSVKASPLPYWRNNKNTTQKTTRHLAEFSTHTWRVLLALGVLGIFCVTPILEPSSSARYGHGLMVLFLLCWFLFHFLLSVASERYSFQIIPFVLLYAAGLIETVKQKLFRQNSQVVQLKEPQRPRLYRVK
jgi:4-amino-4-deoxy-L-arabinose transferase-like glycosyltransferase